MGMQCPMQVRLLTCLVRRALSSKTRCCGGPCPSYFVAQVPLFPIFPCTRGDHTSATGHSTLGRCFCLVTAQQPNRSVAGVNFAYGRRLDRFAHCDRQSYAPCTAGATLTMLSNSSRTKNENHTHRSAQHTYNVSFCPNNVQPQFQNIIHIMALAL